MCLPHGAVTVDGTQLKLPDNWFEDSWTYDCLGGGSVTVLWQLYRPLLGNTVEITTGNAVASGALCCQLQVQQSHPLTVHVGSTDLLQIMVWLVPARKENIPLNVPPYLNAQTSVLQAINDTGYFQVILCPGCASTVCSHSHRSARQLHAVLQVSGLQNAGQP